VGGFETTVIGIPHTGLCFCWNNPNNLLEEGEREKCDPYSRFCVAIYVLEFRV
jgi:hypothetical protein